MHTQTLQNTIAPSSNNWLAKQDKLSFLNNPTAVGTDREEIYRRFLERHVPKSCEVFRGGYIFNLEGVRSRQIDVIVTAGSTPGLKWVADTRPLPRWQAL